MESWPCLSFVEQRCCGTLSLISKCNRRPPTAVTCGPAPNGRQSRSAVIAKNGIVATSQPLAAQAGLDILKAGGNAADAAIAANAVIGLTEPMSCGIGGDLFVIYWDAKSQKLYGLNASGRSPYKLNRQVFADQGLIAYPTTRPARLVGAGMRRRLGGTQRAVWHDAAQRDSATRDRIRRKRISR